MIETSSSLPLRQAKVMAITAMLESSNSSSNAAKSSSPAVAVSPDVTTKRKKSSISKAKKQQRLQSKKDKRTTRSIVNRASDDTVDGATTRESSPAPPAPVVSPVVGGKKQRNRRTFPVKLFELLSSTEDDQDAICWAPDGNSFVIRNKVRFERILPQLGFDHKGLRSFHRQLSYWCFQRRPDRNNFNPKNRVEEWFHPLFVRGMDKQELVTSIHRVAGRKARRAAPASSVAAVADKVASSSATALAQAKKKRKSKNKHSKRISEQEALAVQGSNNKTHSEVAEASSKETDSPPAVSGGRPTRGRPSTITRISSTPRLLDPSKKEKAQSSSSSKASSTSPGSNSSTMVPRRISFEEDEEHSKIMTLLDEDDLMEDLNDDNDECCGAKSTPLVHPHLDAAAATAAIVVSAMEDEYGDYSSDDDLSIIPWLLEAAAGSDGKANAAAEPLLEDFSFLDDGLSGSEEDVLCSVSVADPGINASGGDHHDSDCMSLHDDSFDDHVVVAGGILGGETRMMEVAEV